MKVKQYIQRVMEENNKELINYFRSLLSDSIDSAIQQNNNYLKEYISDQLSALPDIYTREQIQELIIQTIDDYSVKQKANFKTQDGKIIITADNKVFSSNRG